MYKLSIKARGWQCERLMEMNGALHYLQSPGGRQQNPGSHQVWRCVGFIPDPVSTLQPSYSRGGHLDHL